MRNGIGILLVLGGVLGAWLGTRRDEGRGSVSSEPLAPSSRHQTAPTHTVEVANERAPELRNPDDTRQLDVAGQVELGSKTERDDLFSPDPGVGLLERIGELERECDRLAYELLLCQTPEATPFGHFLRSPEGQSITDKNEREAIKWWLNELPVFLRPGEATWLVERLRLKDWKQYAVYHQDAVVNFLGRQRLLGELPAEKIEELRAWYTAHEWPELYRGER